MTDPLTRVEIASVAAGGDGVGRVDGIVVFVPRTAPGDVALVGMRPFGRYARGTLASLELASPLRVEPRCAHYTADRCGGCQIQHLEYSAQLRAKGIIIGDALRRIAKCDVTDPEVEASDPQWRYRRKLTLHLRRTAGQWTAGLHRYDDPVGIFDLRDCPITEEPVLAIWAELRAAFHLLPKEPALRASVRLTAEGAAVVVEGGHAWSASERFFAAVPSVTELWWKPENARPRRIAERAGPSEGGASFAQVNAHVAARLHAHVLERARAYEPVRVVDAYAGTGATALPLAMDGRTVVAIEWDRDAVAALRAHLAPPSSAIAGRVEDHLATALPADVVLLNPPRTGVDARVIEALERAGTKPRGLVYVSCDPATLARDLSRLSSYRLVGVRAYDMFPQTAHVETVCELATEAA